MLVRQKDVLVPQDIDPELLDFILKDEGKGRFIIVMHIPEALNYAFPYDTGHIVVQEEELRVRSQTHSRPYPLHMYAWEHVFCLMPTAKRNRKRGSGWISRNAEAIIEDPQYMTTWHSNDIVKFIGLHKD